MDIRRIISSVNNISLKINYADNMLSDTIIGPALNLEVQLLSESGIYHARAFYFALALIRWTETSHKPYRSSSDLGFRAHEHKLSSGP